MNSDPYDKNFASERLTLKGHSGKIYSICKFGPNVLAAGADNTIRLWDIMRSNFDETFIHEKEVYALAEIRPEFFASGGELKELKVWDYRKTKAPLLKYPI
jgi:WD40 repeat protein